MPEIWGIEDPEPFEPWAPEPIVPEPVAPTPPPNGGVARIAPVISSGPAQYTIRPPSSVSIKTVAPVVTQSGGERGGLSRSAPEPGPSVDDALQRQMDEARAKYEKQQRLIERRSQLLYFTPKREPGRTSRTMAAIFGAVPEIRESLINSETMDVNDWLGATNEYLAKNGIANAAVWAVDQGYMPKPPARTVTELIDQSILDVLKHNGLMAPDLETRVNAQLEQAYQDEMDEDEETQAELDARPKPVQQGGAFLPPIPSTQTWNLGFNAPEREGAGKLFEAMGMTPEQLADQIRRLAPPTGQSALAQAVFRRR